MLLNRKAPAWKPPVEDERVKVSRAPAGTARRRGAEASRVRARLGRRSWSSSTTTTAEPGLSGAIIDAFEDHDGGLRLLGLRADQRRRLAQPRALRPGYGWVYTPGTIDGQEYDRCHALAPTPHNVGYIWYAPNHVRAFRRSAYDEVGGYDAELEYLDDQELMSRLYLDGEFAQIKRCLYFQRVHERATRSASSESTTRSRSRRSSTTASSSRSWRSRGPSAAGCGACGCGPRSGSATSPTTATRTSLVDPEDPRIDADDDSVAADQGLRRAAADAEARGVLQRGLPGARPRRADLHPDAEHRRPRRVPGPEPHGVLQREQLHVPHPERAARRDPGPAGTAPGQPSAHVLSAREGHVDLDIPYVQANLLAVKDGPRQGGPLLC